MITMQEWKEMSGKDKSMWMHGNAKAGNNSFVRRRMSYGIGVFDATYSATKKLDGFTAKCPAYELWQSVLCRALSDDYKSKFPSYDGVKICDEWLTFSEFRKWFIEHHVDGWHLDKDLVSNKKLYSPSTSIFVPKWLNLFVNDHGAARGGYLVGDVKPNVRGKMAARCSNPISGKVEHIGLFQSPQEANSAWRTRKLELALELKPKMDEIDLRIYPRVVEIINNAK